MQSLNEILSNKRWSKIIPVLIFFFGIWYFCLRILGTGLEFIPGDFGDSRFINFLLEHGHQWMHGNAGDFWNANFMHPFPNVIAISDNMLGTMPIYSLWRSLGFSYETSYQLWWIVICSLNFWSAFFVVNKWFKRWDFAILAAWIFAFTIFNFGQFSYMQMMIRFLVPIVFYAGTKMVDTSKLKYLAYFSFGIVIQFYSVIYTGFFLLYFSVFFIIVYAIFKKKYFFFIPYFKKDTILKSLLIIGLSLIAMLWLIKPYMHISEILGFRSYQEIEGLLPTWKTFLFPADASSWTVLYKNFQPDSPYWWLHHNFMGLIPFLCLITIPYFWIYWKIKKKEISPLIWAVTISTFIIFIFFFKTADGHSLYKLLFKLPGMNSIRVMNRFIHVTLFMLLIGLISIFQKLPVKWSYLLFLIVFLDNSFAPDRMIRQEKSEIVDRREDVIKIVKNNIEKKHEAFAIIDSNQAFFITHIDAMQAALFLNIPTINGYSSSGPVNHSQFFQENNMEGLDHWLEHNHISKDSILIIKRDN